MAVVFNKELKQTDIHHRFSVPSASLQYIDFAGEFSVDLRVQDSSGELRVIRCRKRAGDYAKPELSKGWRQYVADYELRVGDRVVLLAEEDHRLGSQYRIEAMRTINLFGHERIMAVQHKIFVANPILAYVDFAGEFSADLRVKDSSGELRVTRCRKRVHGDYAKPELSKGWRKYVTDYELRVGDRAVLLAEEDHRLGSQFRIEAKRRIILFGQEVWGGLPRAN
ncbi:hypothetical protein OIU76_018679 [Salix suchowensis]|nr:hypothetical protein OIU76_018679 [Salix suchowensis]